MPVDYSKWDALELSDDSDIEVHPNVDKRSFIRAKQNQIHMERQQRRHQIETLRYERQINDGLARRIAGLLAVLRSHADEARASSDVNAAGAVAFRAVMENASQMKAGEDRPPKPPAGVHAAVEQPETYTKMMAALLDQVNKALAERQLEGAARYDAMVAEIEGHGDKVADLQRQLEQKLAELEREQARKITSDSIHTGFNSSHVTKATAEPGDSGGKTELLNPGYGLGGSTATKAAENTMTTTTAAAAAAGIDDDDDEVPSTSEAARQFANIRPGSHAESQAFIRTHPELVASDRELEGILVMAFDAEFAGDSEAARRFVHQATLLEFCRALGRDGVLLFFRRMATAGHQAQDVFRRDVQEKYGRIHERVREINAQKAASAASGVDGVEQIQRHAVEPGTVINIHIPPTGSESDVSSETFAARRIFDGFRPEMKKALESGSLDRVNEVLGRMTVTDAEALVGQFSEAGILSMEDEIIDATTEEGRQQLKEMGREDEDEVEDETPAKTETKEEEYPDPE
ncbi:hsp90 co-chaperone cdc37 [Grosmannia clavigera kw1407]|uniref:Hsp90 chaperone protein kinase-targeting subunit n=1 Tax=Grosmannia clavigera (strain kw1407 / UAMH 11150) TaxID=655863 RepID=F0XPY1_GROCL|nr:hsp90 co-chaperone cdc37 [Grosmannia clavigera kw1407]EFX00733.1 hsp90 co-chaperone cdc37 [Grosmannia clavigera kw1407]